MLYASDFYGLAQEKKVAFEKNPQRIPEWLVEILLDYIEQRLLKKLTLGYVTQQANLNRVRGRIDILSTYGKGLLDQGRIRCEYQELSLDTQRNRYILHALRYALLLVEGDLKQRVNRVIYQLQTLGINTLKQHYDPRRDRLGHHEQGDRYMLSAAYLLLSLQIPTQQLDQNALAIPNYTLSWLRRLFEKALGGFYRHHLAQERWQIYTNKQLSWSPSIYDSDLKEYMPKMEADIILKQKNASRTVLIDAKFTNIVTKSYQGHKDIFKSGYLYQIYTYLRSQEYEGSKWKFTDAMFIHPALGQSFLGMVNIQGYPFHFCTVDLTQESELIRSELLRFIQVLG